MQKINVPINQMGQFAGKWEAIKGDRVVAIGETLKEIEPVVSRPRGDKTPDDEIPAAFKVPRKDEYSFVSI